MTAAGESHRKELSGGAAGRERIAKAIARSGLCSRRDAEAMIAAGRVTVNGAVLQSAALDVSAGDVVLVDGKPLSEREPPRLWRYYKPKGRVTTHKDPEGRPTVFEALPEGLPRLISVGRLDFNTEGLLLLTNDGDLARHLELPSTGWARRYRVRAHGTVAQEQLDALSGGVTVGKVHYGPIEATLEREQGDNVWIALTLREGKNREVRRIMEHLGLTVNRLIRVSFGPFMLGDLEPGEIDEVKVSVLKEQLGPRLSRQLGLRRGPLREQRKLPPKRAKPSYLRRKPPPAAEAKEPQKASPQLRRRRILSPDGSEPPQVEEVPVERTRSRGKPVSRGEWASRPTRAEKGRNIGERRFEGRRAKERTAVRSEGEERPAPKWRTGLAHAPRAAGSDRSAEQGSERRNFRSKRRGKPETGFERATPEREAGGRPPRRPDKAGKRRPTGAAGADAVPSAGARSGGKRDFKPKDAPATHPDRAARRSDAGHGSKRPHKPGRSKHARPRAGGSRGKRP